MMGRTLTQLRTLVAIAEHGSLSNAARSLSYAPATISGHIAELERSIGAELVRRRQRESPLTPAGQDAADIARAMLVLHDRLGRIADRRPRTPVPRGRAPRGA